MEKNFKKIRVMTLDALEINRYISRTAANQLLNGNSRTVIHRDTPHLQATKEQASCIELQSGSWFRQKPDALEKSPVRPVSYETSYLCSPKCFTALPVRVLTS